MINDDYVTADIGVASYLITMGLEVQDIRPNGTRSMFVFGPEARNQAEGYWDGSGKISPKEFLDNLRGLKARIFQSSSRY